MQSNSSNSWVMVTGGTGGIGKALIARLAAKGQNVIATAREPDRISTALGPGRVVGVQLDMERPETTSVAAREVARIVGGGGLSGLVNMAGVIVEGPLETTSPAELRRQLEINVVGPFALTQALLPLLKASTRQGGEHRGDLCAPYSAVLRAGRGVKIRASLSQ